MVVFIVMGLMSLAGYDVPLPGAVFGEAQASETGRLAVIRTASFLTMAYFIFRHLRNKRPLSFAAPVQVFVNFLILIGLFDYP